MSRHNRRSEIRVPLQLTLNEYATDQAQQCMSLNLSREGIFLNRLVAAAPRRSGVVGLEFELPGTSETIWARGKVVYDRTDEYFHGTGVRFDGIARLHQRIIDEYLRQYRCDQLHRLLRRVRRNRRVPRGGRWC